MLELFILYIEFLTNILHFLHRFLVFHPNKHHSFTYFQIDLKFSLIQLITVKFQNTLDTYEEVLREIVNTSIWKFIKPNVLDYRNDFNDRAISFHQLWIKCSRLIRKAVSRRVKGFKPIVSPPGSRLFRWSSFDCVDLYKYPDQITVTPIRLGIVLSLPQKTEVQFSRYPFSLLYPRFPLSLCPCVYLFPACRYRARVPETRLAGWEKSRLLER